MLLLAGTLSVLLAMCHFCGSTFEIVGGLPLGLRTVHFQVLSRADPLNSMYSLCAWKDFGYTTGRSCHVRASKPAWASGSLSR